MNTFAEVERVMEHGELLRTVEKRVFGMTIAIDMWKFRGELFGIVAAPAKEDARTMDPAGMFYIGKVPKL